MKLDVEVSSDDIVYAISKLRKDQIVALVIDIDKQVGDWDITEALYGYFHGEHKVFLAEVGEL